MEITEVDKTTQKCYYPAILTNKEIYLLSYNPMEHIQLKLTMSILL